MITKLATVYPGHVDKDLESRFPGLEQLRWLANEVMPKFSR